MISALFLAVLSVSYANEELDYSTNIENFQPAADPYGLTVTESAVTLPHLNVGVGLWWNRADDPIVLFHNGARVANPVDGQDGLVNERNTLDLQVGLGLSEWFSIALDVPVVLWQQGFKPDGQDLASIELDSSGLSDFRIAPKVVFFQTGDGQPFGLAVVPRLILPSVAFS